MVWSMVEVAAAFTIAGAGIGTAVMALIWSKNRDNVEERMAFVLAWGCLFVAAFSIGSGIRGISDIASEHRECQVQQDHTP